MHLFRVDHSQAGPPERPEYFSGEVRLQYLLRPEQPGAVEVIAVFFEAGARTIPHIHETDQVLYFLEGEGVVATERERRPAKAGDIVVIPAGTWHWHGATRTSSACHLSIKPAGPSNWDVPRKNWDEY